MNRLDGKVALISGTARGASSWRAGDARSRNDFDLLIYGGTTQVFKSKTLFIGRRIRRARIRRDRMRVWGHSQAACATADAPTAIIFATMMLTTLRLLFFLH